MVPDHGRSFRQSAMRLLAAGSLLAGAGLGSISARAQEGTPYFRVPMGTSSTSDTVEPTYAWLEQLGTCSTTCGTGTRTTSYQCQNVADYDYAGAGYGLPEADDACVAAGPKPSASTASCTVYTGCGYDWVKPPVEQTAKPWNGNPVGRIGCGWVNVSYAPYCQRTGGGANVVLAGSDHRFCSGDRPDYDQVAAGDADALGYDRDVAQENDCRTLDHDWKPTEWGSWSSGCSAAAVRSRAVTCTRRWSGKAESDAECVEAARPKASETAARYGDCSYSFDVGTWTTWSSDCSNAAVRTRSVTCMRSSDGGEAVPDAECEAHGVSRPSSSQTEGRFEGCTYSAVDPGGWSAWASGCSHETTRSRRYQCRRSNDGGQVVSDTECASRSIGLEEVERSANYASCTHSWQTGAWSDFSSGCSAVATRTRAVWCARDLDGAVTSDDRCGGSERPGASETSQQYGACTYRRGGETAVSGWNSGCSGNAQRTHYYDCVRSDGVSVPAGECGIRGVTTAEVEAAAIYSACTYAIEDAGVGACQFSGQRPHYWRCRRSDGGEVDSATYCGRSNPTQEQCTYSWSYTAGYGEWSACSGGSQSRSISSCTREDGLAVATSLCNSAGYETTVSQSCTPPVFKWTSFKGFCKNALGGASIGDDRDSLPDAAAFKQSCAERGGTCFTHQMSEQHDYDGRRESYNESYVCGSDPVYDPNAVGSYGNANSSGFTYTEVRE